MVKAKGKGKKVNNSIEISDRIKETHGSKGEQTSQHGNESVNKWVSQKRG